MYAYVHLWVVGAKNMYTTIDSKSHLVFNDEKQKKNCVCLAAIGRHIDTNEIYNKAKTSEGQMSRKYPRSILTLLEH